MSSDSCIEFHLVQLTLAGAIRCLPPPNSARDSHAAPIESLIPSNLKTATRAAQSMFSIRKRAQNPVSVH